jgi:hypothetical protein
MVICNSNYATVIPAQDEAWKRLTGNKERRGKAYMFLKFSLKEHFGGTIKERREQVQILEKSASLLERNRSDACPARVAGLSRIA